MDTPPIHPTTLDIPHMSQVLTVNNIFNGRFITYGVPQPHLPTDIVVSVQMRTTTADFLSPLCNSIPVSYAHLERDVTRRLPVEIYSVILGMTGLSEEQLHSLGIKFTPNSIYYERRFLANLGMCYRKTYPMPTLDFKLANSTLNKYVEVEPETVPLEFIFPLNTIQVEIPIACYELRRPGVNEFFGISISSVVDLLPNITTDDMDMELEVQLDMEMDESEVNSDSDSESEGDSDYFRYTYNPKTCNYTSEEILFILCSKVAYMMDYVMLNNLPLSITLDSLFMCEWSHECLLRMYDYSVLYESFTFLMDAVLTGDIELVRAIITNPKFNIDQMPNVEFSLCPVSRDISPEMLDMLLSNENVLTLSKRHYKSHDWDYSFMYRHIYCLCIIPLKDTSFEVNEDRLMRMIDVVKKHIYNDTTIDDLQDNIRLVAPSLLHFGYERCYKYFLEVMGVDIVSDMSFMLDAIICKIYPGDMPMERLMDDIPPISQEVKDMHLRMLYSAMEEDIVTVMGIFEDINGETHSYIVDHIQTYIHIKLLDPDITDEMRERLEDDRDFITLFKKGESNFTEEDKEMWVRLNEW